MRRPIEPSPRRSDSSSMPWMAASTCPRAWPTRRTTPSACSSSTAWTMWSMASLDFMWTTSSLRASSFIGLRTLWNLKVILRTLQSECMCSCTGSDLAPSTTTTTRPSVEAQMSQSLDYSQVNFSLEKYIKQLKPLTIEKNRKANPEEKATDREVSQLRGLLGGMAWPVNQTQPHLSAAISLAQATVSGAKVADLNEANKILRFAKETADIPLTIRAHGSLSQLRFGFYSDASWSTRPDGSSQGGWLLFLASEDQINGDRPFPSDGGRLGKQEAAEDLPIFLERRGTDHDHSGRQPGMGQDHVWAHSMAF